MCEAVSAFMATYGTYVYTAAAAAAAYGSYQSSAVAEETADYQSKVSANNAIVQDRIANDEKRIGMEQAAEHLRKVRAIKGTQRAAFAARGLSLESGSPLDIMESTDFFGGIDAERIAKNQYGGAWQRMAAASGARGDASMYRATANAQNPGVSSGLSLIGSAGTYAGNSMSRV